MFQCFRTLLYSTLFAVSMTLGQANVVDELAERDEFSTLVAAVTAAGLVDTLAAADGVTVFAPDNRAFSRIPQEDLDALLADREALTRVLLYHVVPGILDFNDLESGSLDTLLEDAPVDVEVTGFWKWFLRVEIDDARIRRADIEASNGVIHRIDRVLDPGFEPVPSILEIAKGNDDFSILVSLLEEARYSSALGNEHVNFTVFAPTNAAFEALGAETLEAVQADRSLLRAILRNHLVRGTETSAELAEAGRIRTLARFTLPISSDDSSPTGLSIDGKPIAAADIAASNGVVHVVSEVLLPPVPQSLVDVAVGREDLSTLVTALSAAGLADTFASTKRWPAYTIFAPNDEAFANLPEGTLDALLADPTGSLAGVLKLHVVNARLASSQLFDGQVLHTLANQRLTVSISDEGEVRINNARVAETDLQAENGIIHVLQDVIASEPFTVADYVAEKPHLSTLATAVEAAGLLPALDDADGDLTLFAPIDSAFRKLPEGILEGLLEEPEGALTQILLYHVLGESLSADELVEAETATTLQGNSVEISTETFRFWGWRYSVTRINDARLISTDIAVDNGVIHLIYGVLIPPVDEGPSVEEQ